MKLLSPTNSVYNFKNNANETEKGGIKITYWVRQSMLSGNHVVTQAL